MGSPKSIRSGQQRKVFQTLLKIMVWLLLRNEERLCPHFFGAIGLALSLIAASMTGGFVCITTPRNSAAIDANDWWASREVPLPTKDAGNAMSGAEQ